MTGLAKPYRRALALTLLVFVLYQVISLVVAPWLVDGLGHAAEMERLATELQTRETLSSRLPLLEKRLSDLQKDPQSGKRLLTGANPAIAASGLQASLRAVLAQGGAQIVSLEGLPGESDKDQESLAHVTMRVVFRGSEETVRDVLNGITKAVPFLYIERLAINATGTHVADTKAAASHLIVTLEVFGYWRNEHPQPAPAKTVSQ